MLKLIPLLLALGLQTPQPPTTQQIRDSLQAIQQQLEQLLTQLAPPPPVDVGLSELQAKLDLGGELRLLPGQTYTSAGGYRVTRPGTRILANGATLHGTGAPALTILADDVEVLDLVATSGHGTVVQCGSNTATQWATQPRNVRVTNLRVPTHRGKRALEVNCGITVTNPQLLDVWSPALQDSQAINVLNTCGPVTIRGGKLEAASENFLSGGSVLALTDCPEGVVTDILLEDVELSKPDGWRTDGVRRAVKNLLEIKAGKRVTARRLKLRGSWGTQFTGLQDGSAIVITPKNAQLVGDVTLEQLDVDEVGSIMQLMGKDYNSVTPVATTNVALRDSKLRIRRAWGRGLLAVITGGMQAATWERNDIVSDGNALIVCDTTTPVGPLTFTGNRTVATQYVLMAPGVNFAGPAPAGSEQRACVSSWTGNTMSDAPSTFKRNHPSNTWVTRAELDAILATPR